MTGLVILGLIALIPWTQAAVHPQHPDLFGKPCSKDPDADPSLVHCDINQNMYCSDKEICECIVGERGRIFAHNHKTCIEVATPENNYACKDDSYCTKSSFGRYSRCNRDYDRCECYDPNEKVILVDDICYLQHTPQRLASARGLQGCHSDGDCQGSSLGALSRCNGAEHTCECYDTASSGKQEIAVYNGRCLYKKMLFDFCNEDDECRVGYHKNAECAPHPSYLPQEKVCQCPQGKSCDGGSGAFSRHQTDSKTFAIVSLSTFIMGLLATKVFS